LTNPQNLSFDSYLVNHSLQYGLAALASWLEFWLEAWAFGHNFMRQLRFISLLGLAACILGELVR
jgi:protein-S-isoprenylcysteine O-methyltransferase